ncbi:MAG: cupin-like domain-containing protein, partial [Myxococcales bacterium]|nr:cupin-like domain-containing protein [Myxococcales bacterium]
SSWTPAWFKERYPDKRVSTDQGEMRLSDFMDAITSDSGEPGPFLREQPLEDVFPDLVDHVLPTPEFVRPNWLQDDYRIGRVNRRLNREGKIEVNFAGRRVFPYLHIDDLGVHAFITQHYGSKEFTVFAPDQEPYLYRRGTERFSEIVDVDNVDTTKYPLFAKAKGTKVVVNAGESLFNPFGWWHTTRVPGASLATVVSLSNASNWSELVTCLRGQSGRPLLAAGLAAYLTAVGTAKSLLPRSRAT